MAGSLNICRHALWRALAVVPTAARPAASSRAVVQTLAVACFVPSSRSPFSTTSPSRNAPAGVAASVPASEDGASARTVPVSSCPEGTVLVGLNYTKGRTDPVALRDEEYPAWLWDCLDVMKTASSEDADMGDEFSKSKKQRRMALRRQRELEARVLATGDITALAPKIPLQQQTVNLPTMADDMTSADPLALENTIAAAAKRRELRVALRKERRAKIKESNYLRSM